MSKNDDMVVNGKKIEDVDRYVYLEMMMTKDHDQVQENRTGMECIRRLNNIMRDKNVPMRLKRKAFSEWVLPVTTYGSETWSLSKNPTWETDHNPEKGGDNHGRSHPQG